jgi:hypothetical protein
LPSCLGGQDSQFIESYQQARLRLAFY